MKKKRRVAIFLHSHFRQVFIYCAIKEGGKREQGGGSKRRKEKKKKEREGGKCKYVFVTNSTISTLG